MLLNILRFIGNLHPLLVHLPIGILLMALLLEFLARKQKNTQLSSAVTVILFWASLSAIAAAVSGYYLAENDQYDEITLNRHKWMGIFTALVSSVAWLLKKNVFLPNQAGIYSALCVALLILITITGHYGGTLTHGSGYLTNNLPQPVKNVLGISQSVTEKEWKPITNVQEAGIYEELIARVVQKKCQSCHGPQKQKGGLRLDNPAAILKGSKNGKILESGSPEESELFKRLILPLDDEDHMPPKEKSQLSKNEIALIHWWIKQGGDFTKKVREVAQTDSIKTLLAGFEGEENTVLPSNPILPSAETVPAPAETLTRLREMDVIVQPLSPGTHYLEANFVNVKEVPDTIFSLLGRLEKQLLILKMTAKPVTDSQLLRIAGLKGLKRLSLDYTHITDNGLPALRNMQELEYLNLVGTNVSGKGLENVYPLQKLSSLYLFKTGIGLEEFKRLQDKMPSTKIDTGGYLVPVLASDTTELKREKTKKKP